MTHQIRVVVESLNDAGDIIGKEIIMTKSVIKPNTIIASFEFFLRLHLLMNIYEV